MTPVKLFYKKSVGEISGVFYTCGFRKESFLSETATRLAVFWKCLPDLIRQCLRFLEFVFDERLMTVGSGNPQTLQNTSRTGTTPRELECFSKKRCSKSLEKFIGLRSA